MRFHLEFKVIKCTLAIYADVTFFYSSPRKPLTGCHLLACYLFVAHRPTASSTDCFLMAAASVFRPFLALPFPSPATMLKHKHLNKSEDENVWEQREKNRAKEAILFLFSSESGTVCHFQFFFNIYSTDSFSVADRTPLFWQPFLALNHEWLIGNGYKCNFQSL